MEKSKNKLLSYTFGDKVFLVINFVFTLLIFIIILYPLVYIVSASISSPRYVSSGEMWLLPKGITFEGYIRVFQDSSLWRGYRNTIIYTVLGTLINLAVTLPAGFALSKKIKGRGVIMGLMVFTMFFSGGMIPSYLLIQNLGLMNSFWALILPVATSTYNIVICRTFFSTTIPGEIQEAAVVDGCDQFKVFFKIVLPLAKALIAVMVLFFAVGHWNSYFSAMIYLQDKSLYPLQLVLREILIVESQGAATAMTGGALTDEAAKVLANKAELSEIVKYAVMIVSTLPIIMVYPFLQKYFMQGIMIGAVKG